MSSTYGFYARNNNGGLLCCNYAAALYEVRPVHPSGRPLIWHDDPVTVYKDMDAYDWSTAYDWQGWGARSYRTRLVKWTVHCLIPKCERNYPKLFFTARDPSNVWVTSEPYETRTTWETSGGTSQTWTEGRSNTPSMVVTVDNIAFDETHVYQNCIHGVSFGLDHFIFTVFQSINDDGVAERDWSLLFRVFAPVGEVDYKQHYGMEVYGFVDNGQSAFRNVCFTTRPHPDFYLYNLMQIDSVVTVDPPAGVADPYSMAPVGTPISIDKRWVSYSTGGVGAKIGNVTVYRSHKGGDIVEFIDNYYFMSHGFFCSGVTPGAATDGNIYSSYITLNCERQLGKDHSEGYGLLGLILGIVAVFAAVFTGGLSLAAAVGVGAVVGTAIAGMSFHRGMRPGDTRTDILQRDAMVVLR